MDLRGLTPIPWAPSSAATGGKEVGDFFSEPNEALLCGLSAEAADRRRIRSALRLDVSLFSVEKGVVGTDFAALDGAVLVARPSLAKKPRLSSEDEVCVETAPCALLVSSFDFDSTSTSSFARF